MAKDVGHGEEEISCCKIPFAVVWLVHEMKRVAERIEGDHVACAGFEYVMHLDNLTGLAGLR